MSPSDLEHAIVGAFTFRLYFLNTASGVLAIEIDDSTGGKHLDGYDVVVRSLKFGLT